MKHFLPNKDFKIEVLGTIIMLAVTITGAVCSIFALASIETALYVNLSILGITSFTYWMFYAVIPYGTYLISDFSVEQKKLGFTKLIEFDEITEIHRVELTQPYAYWGQYYYYVKSRTSKIKFCDRIQNYEELLQNILEKCDESSFKYSEDPLNKWWRR